MKRALGSELTTQLGYEKHALADKNSGNLRNGHSSKTIKCDDGEVELSILRDRNDDFTPQLIPKNQTRFDGFDDKIIAIYARGMTTHDIQSQLEELYNVDVSATLISNVTNAVLDEVKAWQFRVLNKVYPIVYLDCLVIKVREDKRIVNKSFYLALGVNLEGHKELLGVVPPI